MENSNLSGFILGDNYFVDIDIFQFFLCQSTFSIWFFFPEIPIYSLFIASFKLKDKEFVPELNDKSSSEYTELSQSVKTNVSMYIVK